MQVDEGSTSSRDGAWYGRQLQELSIYPLQPRAKLHQHPRHPLHGRLSHRLDLHGRYDAAAFFSGLIDFFFKDGNKDNIGLKINFYKRHLVYNVIHQILRFQQVPYVDLVP